MKTLLALTVLALTGCASNQPPPSPIEQRAKLECTYEAQKATASILNGFEQGFMTGRLTRQCMQLRGFN